MYENSNTNSEITLPHCVASKCTFRDVSCQKKVWRNLFFGSHVTQNVIQDVLKLIVHTVNFFWKSFLTFMSL